MIELGDGLGEFVIANHDADKGEYPEEQQGIIVWTRKHKTGDKMEAITFLSLVDLSLMDAYYTIARNYIGSENFGHRHSQRTQSPGPSTERANFDHQLHLLLGSTERLPLLVLGSTLLSVLPSLY